ncbi:22825_t:CDS:1, partial [Racocetra persica]
ATHFTICIINELLTSLQENINVEFLNPIINQGKNFESQENQDSDSSISS